MDYSHSIETYDDWFDVAYTRLLDASPVCKQLEELDFIKRVECFGYALRAHFGDFPTSEQWDAIYAVIRGTTGADTGAGGGE